MRQSSTKGGIFGKPQIVDFTLSTIGGYKSCMAITTRKFADTVGRKHIADALGIRPTAVSNAVVRGVFPPAWYETCQRLGSAEGIDCPPELFGQLPFHSTKRGHGSATVQGQGPEKAAS